METIQTRFGPLDFKQDDVVTFAEGLIGFYFLRRFLLLAHNPESPFRWLQSVDEPSLAFLVVEPSNYVQDYIFDVADEVASDLRISDTQPPLVLVTASIPPGKPKEMTVNLVAPLVVNVEARRGRQVILESDAYTMKHRVFSDAPDGERVAA